MIIMTSVRNDIKKQTNRQKNMGLCYVGRSYQV